MKGQLAINSRESFNEERECSTDEELEDEELCEAYFSDRRKSIISEDSEKIPIGHNIRRDLLEVLTLKNNESLVRKQSANILRLYREEAHNGYKNLSPEEQEKILNLRLRIWPFLFGNHDIFYSRRKIKYKTNKRGICEKRLSLGRELTMLTYWAYKPKELFPQ